MADQAQSQEEDTTREASDVLVLCDDDAAALLSGASWSRFAVIGDSLAEGLGDGLQGYRTRPWADRTADVLRIVNPTLEYLNIGRRELKVAEIIEQQLAAGLEFHPDLVAVVAGGNDLATADWNPDHFEARFDELVGAFRAAGAEVVTYALLNVAKTRPYMEPMTKLVHQYNSVVHAVSHRHDAVLVDMWNHEISDQRDVISADMIHLKSRGHAIVGTETVHALARRLATHHAVATAL
jgi:lysophospholipase L1-like esterase